MTDIETEVRSAMGAVFNVEITTTDHVRRADTPTWDSLKHVELLFVLEDTFSVEFKKEELAGLDSVDALVTAIERAKA